MAKKKTEILFDLDEEEEESSEDDSSEDESSTEDLVLIEPGGSPNVAKYVKMGGITALLFALGYTLVRKFQARKMGTSNYDPVNFGF